MPKYINKRVLHLCSGLGAGLCAAFVIYGFHRGIFTSQEALEHFVGGMGVLGAAAFVAFQMVQVVIPILPGGLGCVAGVILFGPWMGFVYNYVGICLGSLAAFLLARLYGRPILSMLFRQETICRYEGWTQRHFHRWFAAAIFFPVAPDDFLCWLAGTTRMSLRRFCAIILLGKPASIALYSLGLTTVFRWVSGILPA